MEKVGDIGLKIKRAEKHIKDFQLALAAFSDSKPYRLGVKRNPQTRQPIYYLAEARDVPPEFSLLCGDALQNLRSSLDYLACALVMANGKIPDSQTAFPILDEVPKSPQDKPFRRKIKGMKQDVVDAIWEIKPYKGGDDALWLLHALNKIDKHRLLVTVGHYFTRFDSAEHLAETKPVLPRGPTTRLAHHYWIGTKFLKAGDDLLIDFPDAKVNKNIKFAIDIAFNEPGVCEGEPLFFVLRNSLNRVRKLVSDFARFLL